MKKQIFTFLSLTAVTAIAFAVSFTAIPNNEVHPLSVLEKSSYSITIAPFNSKIENNTLSFKSQGGSEIKFDYNGYIEEYRLDDKFFVFGSEENIFLTPRKGESRIRDIDRIIIKGQKLGGLEVYKVYYEGDNIREESHFRSETIDDEMRAFDLRGDDCSYFSIKKRYPDSLDKMYVKTITITYSCKPGSENV